MNHLTDEQLLDLYYGETSASHIEECAECRARLAELRRSLDSLRNLPVPERGALYGAEVWNRLAPHLPMQEREKPRSRRAFWLYAPALAAMLAIAFISGVWLEHSRSQNRSDDRERLRERVLLIAMSDHLERSQILLTELLHANPSDFDLAAERGRARDLLSQNRLLRQTALQLGNRPQAAVLDDLERVLISLANSPENSSSDETKMLQQSVKSDRLLWKVRITGSNARERGQKL